MHCGGMNFTMKDQFPFNLRLSLIEFNFLLLKGIGLTNISRLLGNGDSFTINNWKHYRHAGRRSVNVVMVYVGGETHIL